MSTPSLMVVGAVLLLGAAFLAWLSIEFVNRRPEFGAGALFVWLGALVLGEDHPEWFVRAIAGINFTVPDVLCTLLGAVAALRFFRDRAPPPRHLRGPLLVLGGALVLSYIRGVGAFGVQHATNEFREFYYFLTALAFSVSFPFARLGRHLPGLGVLGGCLLVAVALIHLAAMPRLDLEHRPLPSAAALAVGEAFFLGWFWLRGGRRARVWAALVLSFLPFSFFMLHRSVWMCLGAGLAALLALDPPGRKKLLTLLVAGGMTATVGVALFFRDTVARALDGAVHEATSSEDSTFIWRIEGWVALLGPGADHTAIDLLVGRPMGSGYARRLGDSVVNTEEIEAGVIPHNYYISTLLRGGLVGLAALLLLYATLLRSLFRAHRRAPALPEAPCFLVILLMQLVYYVPYSADFIQGLLLGGAIALAVALQPDAAARLCA